MKGFAHEEKWLNVLFLTEGDREARVYQASLSLAPYSHTAQNRARKGIAR